IKVHDSLPEATFLAIAAQAKRLGMPFAGHVPPSVSAIQASDAGEASIEHLGGTHYAVLLACSNREAELHARLKELMKAEIDAAFGNGKADQVALYRTGLIQPLVDSFSADKAAILCSRFVRNNTWQVPTLATLQSLWNRGGLGEADIASGKKMLGK